MNFAIAWPRTSVSFSEAQCFQASSVDKLSLKFFRVRQFLPGSCRKMLLMYRYL